MTNEYIQKNTFYKVSDKTEIRFESSVKNCVFQHWSKFILDIFWKMSDFETYNLKNSLKCSVSGLGSIKKRFLMVESCLEHISKLSLVRKIIFWGITSQRNIRIEAEKSCFSMDGWKLCQKMRLDALIIFLIEWRHHVSYLGGKQSKYWGQQNIPRRL